MTAIYESRDSANAATEKLKIYAQPQRLMILSHLMEGERTVSEIDEATGIGQPALSQQLAALRRAGVVETRRMAKQIYYRLANDSVIACVKNIEGMFSKNGARQTAAKQAAEKPAATPAIRTPAGAAKFAQIL
ncbi:MAG: metalloregulator ArsR/SmtB family transcription factor [Acidocella sp.]|nr:metalloregulator ArsR/SmtB family transcription factor [Acidocella sp.]